MSAPASQKVRVLLIVSDPGQVLFLRELLLGEPGSDYEITQVAATLGEGVEKMQAGEVDLVLLDLTLPDSAGLDTFLQARRALPGMPIIVLGNQEDEELALQAVHRGAQEYLIKGRLDAHLLLRAMRYALERSRAEAALGQERGLFHTLLENVPDRIYFKDDQSRFIRINRALMELFELERPEQAYGKTDADFYTEEHAREAREDECQVMLTGDPMLGKVELEVLAGGHKSWSLTTKLPLRDLAGRIIGTCGISREITAIKEMEEQLASERNLLRSLIDNLPDHIYLTDAQGDYLLDNVAHQRFLGASSTEEVLGRNVFDFFPDAIAEKLRAVDEAILQSGQAVVNREEQISDIDGNPHWVLSTKVPRRNEAGEINSMVGISRDITEQKQAEESLRRAYAELTESREEMVGAMAKLQSAHRELRAVQLQLIEAEKMKSVGRLAAGVAHEVKNPLAILKMGLDFLKTGAGAQDPTTESVLADMSDAVRRANLVIGGLLDFSTPKKLAVQAENLNAILDRALTLIRGEVKGIVVEREFQRDLPLLHVDAAKIEQVFINLLTNSLHAMHGTGTLLVRTLAKQLTGVGANVGDSRSESFRVGDRLVVAEINDTGEGIPDEKLSKIFEPFYTTKATGEGTGLGLSVVKTIIDLHGATIDVRNLPEGGTRVTITFRA